MVVLISLSNMCVYERVELVVFVMGVFCETVGVFIISHWIRFFGWVIIIVIMYYNSG